MQIPTLMPLMPTDIDKFNHIIHANIVNNAKNVRNADVNVLAAAERELWSAVGDACTTALSRAGTDTSRSYTVVAELLSACAANLDGGISSVFVGMLWAQFQASLATFGATKSRGTHTHTHHTHTHTLTHTHARTHTHTLTHSLTHSLTHKGALDLCTTIAQSVGPIRLSAAASPAGHCDTIVPPL
jgi:hypothetical protein